MLSSLMASVEGAEQPLAERVSDGVREAASGVALTVPGGGGDDSWQCTELKWSSSAEESGAVKSQRRQRQHAWTRLQRDGQRVTSGRFKHTRKAAMLQIETQSTTCECFHGLDLIRIQVVGRDQRSSHVLHQASLLNLLLWFLCKESGSLFIFLCCSRSH